jgi:ubiquitin-like 1-activating enzyme E1 A
MASSSVLYIHVTGLSSEIIKNLVLAGIRAVICDNRTFPDAIQDTPSIFLTNDDRDENKGVDDDTVSHKRIKRTVADVMKSKIEELNPLLGDCEICNENVSQLTSEYISKFSIIVASRLCSMTDAIRIANVCTAAGNKFYMADCFGLKSVSVLDLGKDHTYRPEIGKKLLDVTTLKQHVPLASIFNDVRLHDATNRFHKTPPPSWIQYRCILEYVERKNQWPDSTSAVEFAETILEWVHTTSPSLIDHELLSRKALQDLAQIATVEIAPVCSVLGGVLGNEIIKAISGKGEPANNTLLFDGLSCKAWTFLVQPKP